MAAVALAIRLYVVDQGCRPAHLKELVPVYLPAVPLDPFSAENATIRYRLKPGPAVLYSVGGDGTDNGGVIARRPDGRRDSDNSDILFYLDGRPDDAIVSTPRGSAKAGNNDEDEENSERNADEKNPAQ